MDDEQRFRIYRAINRRIDKEKGERWFCSESQAVDAGWRKAR